KTIPPIPLHIIHGDTAIAPAEVWERINNVETPQLYPVFPWGIYGLDKPNLQYALNTWYLDSAAIKNRSYVGWKQDNIFAARLGLTDQAAHLTLQKLSNSPRRFPAFWGPGFDCRRCYCRQMVKKYCYFRPGPLIGTSILNYTLLIKRQWRQRSKTAKLLN